MTILYAIQGTGNGHVSRAREIIPLLQQYGNVDILISGTQADIGLEQAVKYKYNGFGFIFGKKGGVDVMATYRKNNLRRFRKEIKSLPVEKYDLVISDFEPVSAWACHLKGKACIGLSHQCAVLHPKAPQPKQTDMVGQAVLRHYAPATVHYGFHFVSYADHIFTPVIRKEVRELAPVNNGHCTVYLPAYSDKRILKHLSQFPEVKWEVFSKHNKKAFVEGNISVKPISNKAFINSMAGAEGVLCGAGFETPAEALFLQKKLMVIPMKGQYEQHCNAAALKKMGVPVLKSLKEKHIEKIAHWLRYGEVIPVDYPDDTATIIKNIIETAPLPLLQKEPSSNEPIPSVRQFKDYLLRKIFTQMAR